MNKFIPILFFLLFAYNVNAQNFRLGFQASPHFTWMSSSNTNITNIELNPGIKYGLEADLFLAGFPRYSLNTGLFVTHHTLSGRYAVSESFYINSTTFSEPTNIDFKLNYLEIPLNIKLKSDQFYRMRFYGQFGLSNLINLSASATSSNEDFSGEVVNSDFLNRTINFYNLSLMMGGGVEYDVGGNTALNFGLQYSNGLIDVTSIGNLEEKTVINSLRIVLGVMF